jgi:large subunit ribosomal protein L4
MQVSVYNIGMEKVGTVELPDEIFAVDVNEALLWEQVKSQLTNRRSGTHKTKKRGEVSGGGIKPRRQKGSGQARQGSIRAPHWVGGGTVFGPQPRDYGYRLPRTARRAALKSVLALRAKSNDLIIIDEIALERPRTQAMAEFVNKAGAKSALLLDVENTNLRLSTRNLPSAKYVPGHAVNVYDVLHHEKLVLTKAVIDIIVEKINPSQSNETATAA